MGKVRTTKPGAGDKYFIRQANGGFSTCIQGKPTDKYCNVLANCVGYACGAYNEQENLGYEKYHLNCNAENFIERAIASGLSVVSKPVVGGILVWQKGATLSGSDGAGHVAICIEKGNGYIRTAESGYGSSAFWISKRTNSNGKWGAGADYRYRGCIISKTWKPDTPTPAPTPTPTPSAQKFAIGEKVIINGGLYVNSNAAKATGSASNKITTITRYAAGAKHPYNTTGDLGWMNESDIQKYSEQPQPSYQTYTVRPGDNLSKIAQKYGTTWQKIYNDNKSVIGSNPNLIRPGQVLVIK